MRKNQAQRNSCFHQVQLSCLYNYIHWISINWLAESNYLANCVNCWILLASLKLFYISNFWPSLLRSVDIFINEHTSSAQVCVATFIHLDCFLTEYMEKNSKKTLHEHSWNWIQTFFFGTHQNLFWFLTNLNIIQLLKNLWTSLQAIDIHMANELKEFTAP